MENDELTVIQEELAEARAELERLEATAADREARAAHFETQLAQARDELARAQSDAQSREEALAEQARSAAVRYRELALTQSPDLPADLVTGESVDDVDASLQRARETVARVRGHIESQAQASRVPAGAPERGKPDVSALSAEEKIRLGLGRRSE